MHRTRAILSSGIAAALALAFTGAAFAQQTTPPNPPPTSPATATQQPVRYEQCNTATPNEATGQPPTSGNSQSTANSQAGTSTDTSSNSTPSTNGTSTSADGGTTSPSTNSGVDTSTTGNSSTQPVQPCAHQGVVKGKTPTMTPAAPVTAPAMPATSNGSAGTTMDALNNNPNGSNWLDKFNRPNIATTTHAHHMKRTKNTGTSGGGL